MSSNTSWVDPNGAPASIASCPTPATGAGAATLGRCDGGGWSAALAGVRAVSLLSVASATSTCKTRYGPSDQNSKCRPGCPEQMGWKPLSKVHLVIVQPKAPVNGDHNSKE